MHHLQTTKEEQVKDYNNYYVSPLRSKLWGESDQQLKEFFNIV